MMARCEENGEFLSWFRYFVVSLQPQDSMMLSASASIYDIYLNVEPIYM